MRIVFISVTTNHHRKNAFAAVTRASSSLQLCPMDLKLRHTSAAGIAAPGWRTHVMHLL